ncbi:hypothetical protein VB711_14090 [Cronbergia sp. UHCC 0137]|uniref:hypothetical protein n=1 Tax=Cronbergia sp. UHCC 0137 TaxID=3110239 RepID=UPI002B1EE3A0|nr:hypothetical protein [Cronbergia sp. UHCC 0137]MEA5618962.1 hypothetical protein [Cronbergia sp. UHCC 0137]
MIKTVEPSGVILKDICDIQTEKCVAKDSPAAITAVWYSPGRKQVNVCRACLDEMVRRGEWEVKGARLKHRADIVIFDPKGKVKLIAEVKKISLKEKSAQRRASEIRRNLLVHSGIPNTPFFLVAFPDNFYLWKEDISDIYDKPADYRFDAKNTIDNYADKKEVSPLEMSERDFEFLVSDWLKDLVNAKSPEDSLEWATKSGLYDAIRDGSVAIEVALQ